MMRQNLSVRVQPLLTDVGIRDSVSEINVDRAVPARRGRTVVSQRVMVKDVDFRQPTSHQNRELLYHNG